MPYKKKYSRRKRKYNRNRRNTATNTGPMTPIGRSFKSTMKYNETQTLSSGLGALAVAAYSANGLFDPSISLIGHQPMGFDQIMPLYDHYCVIGSMLRVDFINTTPTSISDTQEPIIVGIQISDRADTTITTLDRMLEQPAVKYTTLLPSISNGAKKTLYIKCNPNKYLGKSKPLSDDTTNGSIVANPVEQVYYKLFAQNLSQSTEAFSVQANISIMYTSIFHEPKSNLAQS